MAKKNKNVYFNLFNVESDIDQENEASSVNEENAKTDRQQFFSITDFDLDKNIENENQEIKGQLSMFNEVAFEISVNQVPEKNQAAVFEAQEIEEEIVIAEDEHMDDEAEFAKEDEVLEENGALIEEIAQELAATEEIIEEDQEPEQEFFIEPVIKEAEEAAEEDEDIIVIEEESQEEDEDIAAKNDPVEEMLVSALETNALDESYVAVEEENLVENTNIFENILEYDAIKKQSAMEGFETPYVFHGKNGDRVRYRLSLPSDSDPKRNRLKKSVTGWIVTIAFALILATLIRMFVFVVATVDGPSMQPTLTNNDRLLVTKYTYYFADIQRGDIVICKYNDPAYPDMYVKRVIGLPGETISIIDGVVHINGTALQEDYTTKSLPGLDRYYNMEAYYIPEGHVFVMGDNRNNSADSRLVTNGAISTDLIIGKAQVRIFPFDNMGSLEESN